MAATWPWPDKPSAAAPTAGDDAAIVTADTPTATFNVTVAFALQRDDSNSKGRKPPADVLAEHTTAQWHRMLADRFHEHLREAIRAAFCRTALPPDLQARHLTLLQRRGVVDLCNANDTTRERGVTAAALETLLPLPVSIPSLQWDAAAGAVQGQVTVPCLPSASSSETPSSSPAVGAAAAAAVKAQVEATAYETFYADRTGNFVVEYPPRNFQSFYIVVKQVRVALCASAAS